MFSWAGEEDHNLCEISLIKLLEYGLADKEGVQLNLKQMITD